MPDLVIQIRRGETELSEEYDDCRTIYVFKHSHWEWLRVPVMQAWKQRSRGRWNAQGGSNGGAERTAWTVMEMCSYHVYDLDEGFFIQNNQFGS